MRKHQLIIVILALALVSAACGDRTLPGAQAGAETLPTTTTTTTTTPPTTTTSSTTTTSTTSTTTTTTTTTTVPPVPECVDSFYWGPEDDNIADFGPLTDPEVNEVGYTWFGAAACLLEILYEDTVLLDEETTVVYLRFLFTEQGADDEIIRDFFLGLEGGPEVAEVSWWHPKGSVVPIDPDATANEANVSVSGIPTADFVEKLVVGRLYPVTLIVDKEDRTLPDWCPDRWLCAINDPLRLTDSYPRGHASHSNDVLDYNYELYKLLRGNTVPEPEFKYGDLYAVYLVPIYDG